MATVKSTTPAQCRRLVNDGRSSTSKSQAAAPAGRDIPVAARVCTQRSQIDDFFINENV